MDRLDRAIKYCNGKIEEQHEDSEILYDIRDLLYCLDELEDAYAGFSQHLKEVMSSWH